MNTSGIIKSPAVSEYQSILDVFLLQGLINYQDYQTIKNKFSTNLEIEAFLLKNKLLSVDSINRAYSIIYKMPFVDLKNLKVEQSVLELASPEFIKRYRVAPFSMNNGVLSLAIARPSSISSITPELEKYFAAKARLVNLYITTTSDLEEIIKQYSIKNKDLLLSKTNYPTVFLKNQNISKELIQLLPPEFISKYHLVIFNKRDSEHYLIASDRIDNPETIKAVQGVEDQNKIFLELFATSSEDISYVFSLMNQEIPSKESTPKPVEKAETPSFISGIKDLLKNGDKPELTVDSVVKSSPESPTNLIQEKTITNDQKEAALVPDSVSQEKDKQSSPIEEAAEDIGALLEHDIADVSELNTIIKSGQVPKIVASVINFALTMRASDVHLEPEENNLRIRYRVDGILSNISVLGSDIQPQIISRIKILANLKLDESRVPQDGRFEVDFERKQVDIRVSTLPTVRGEKVVMRLLDKSQGILSLEDLGMTGQAFKKTLEAIAKPYGIIISTGPTGSGKSTTLYAILNRISKPAVNIVTIEDPVEYEIPGINQCQIKPKIGFTFADGLRSILRQDPNVIMVGEVRDTETASMATHAALTGHLVLTTLHTNDAAGALPRLTNMGVEPFLITSSINLIIGQRLVRRICPKCREEIKITANLRTQIEEELVKIPESKDAPQKNNSPYKFYQGRGCQECNQGYRGRLGIFEVLSVGNKIEDMVIGRSSSSEILKQAQTEGMITMRQDGLLKATEGLTTLDEVIRVTNEF